MPPVQNTYSTRNTKRVRIPKFVYKDVQEDFGGDVFNALHMESIKVKKAEALKLNKRKRKRVGKENLYPKVATAGDADDTFDRLLQEGPIYNNTHATSLTKIFNLTSSPETGRGLISPEYRFYKKNQGKINKSKQRKNHRKNGSIFLSDSSSFGIDKPDFSTPKLQQNVTRRKKIKPLKCASFKVSPKLRAPVINVTGLARNVRSTSTSTPCKSENLQEECGLSPIIISDSPIPQKTIFSPQKDKTCFPVKWIPRNSASCIKNSESESGDKSSIKSCNLCQNRVESSFHQCAENQNNKCRGAQVLCTTPLSFIDVENLSHEDSCPGGALQSRSQEGHEHLGEGSHIIHLENTSVKGSSKTNTTTYSQSSLVLLPCSKLSESIQDVSFGVKKCTQIIQLTDESEINDSHLLGHFDSSPNNRNGQDCVATVSPKSVFIFSGSIEDQLDQTDIAGCKVPHNPTDSATDELCELLMKSLSCESTHSVLSHQENHAKQHVEKSHYYPHDKNMINNLFDDCHISKENKDCSKLVLKPGKHWRRSLSMYSSRRKSNTTSLVEHRKSENSCVLRSSWVRNLSSEILRETECEVSSSAEQDCSCSIESADNPCKDLHYYSDWASRMVLSLCGQNEPLPFLSCYPPSMKVGCRKIGEGVYGEVFLYNGRARHETSVIKIIPIEGEIKVNGEPQKKYEEILSEIFIAQQLSDLQKNGNYYTTSFNKMHSVRCVKGSYPSWLQDLWINYDEVKGSENDPPTMFTEDQLFIILEMSDGGKDLESFVFTSAEQGLAAFQQVAVAMAVGERALNFEHRDLHWGNILISSTNAEEVDFSIDGTRMCIATKGIKVSIIDFTLSRINDPLSNQPIFYNLADDETLFTAQGDYQFEVYRLMRHYCGNDWSAFAPKTNIVWLHYLLDKLCLMARYRNRSSRRHKQSLDALLRMRDNILNFRDAFSFIRSSEFEMK